MLAMVISKKQRKTNSRSDEMANKNLFAKRGANKANAYNEAGGVAYQLSPQAQLAQLAATGCLNHTYYTTAEDQLSKILELTQDLPAEFIAKTALFARKQAHMKDMPALLLAVLAQKDVAMCAQIFGAVIDNGKMLRNFVQIMRSGAVGRKSLGTRPKKLVQNWLLNASEAQLLSASVGNTPSLADVVKMVHPKPDEAWRAAWFAWLIGREYSAADLPALTQEFERFKHNTGRLVPNVPFQLLTALDLNKASWRQIAEQGSWQMVRQNLNTFMRHGVLVAGKDNKEANMIARKLADKDTIAKERVLPYQIMTSLQAVNTGMPKVITDALASALETSLMNVPRLEGNVHVCMDVSGSMTSPVTGYREGATSVTTCLDIAALIAAAMVARNPHANVLPFDDMVRLNHRVSAENSVLKNAQILQKMLGGATDCAAPLRYINDKALPVDLVVFVSDNQSWVNNQAYYAGTSKMQEWGKIKARNPRARMVCIDIQPYTSVQAEPREDVLHVGDFSDAVFTLLNQYARGELGSEHWVGVINAVPLPN